MFDIDRSLEGMSKYDKLVEERMAKLYPIYRKRYVRKIEFELWLAGIRHMSYTRCFLIKARLIDVIPSTEFRRSQVQKIMNRIVNELWTVGIDVSGASKFDTIPRSGCRINLSDLVKVEGKPSFRDASGNTSEMTFQDYVIETHNM
jgi:hypothetical protein